jgi:hypothetical protein
VAGCLYPGLGVLVRADGVHSLVEDEGLCDTVDGGITSLVRAWVEVEDCVHRCRGQCPVSVPAGVEVRHNLMCSGVQTLHP